MAVLKECTLKPLYDACIRKENERTVERLMDYWNSDEDERNVKDSSHKTDDERTE